jgi:hypothetical protein
MIEVKLNFASQAELLAFFAGTRTLVSADEKAAAAACAPPVKEATTKPGKPAPTPAANVAAPAAKTETAAESPSEGKPVAAETPAAETASSAKPDASAPVEYETLRSAVMTLAGKNKPRALEIIASFGVKTMKELDAARWGEALGVVNEALAA